MDDREYMAKLLKLCTGDHRKAFRDIHPIAVYDAQLSKAILQLEKTLKKSTEDQDNFAKTIVDLRSQLDNADSIIKEYSKDLQAEREASARINDTVTAREKTIINYDNSIQKYKDTVAKLSEEIKSLKCSDSLDQEIRAFVDEHDNVLSFKVVKHEERQHVFFVTDTSSFDWDLNDECGSFDLRMWENYGINTHSIALSQANMETTGAIDGIVSGEL